MATMHVSEVEAALDFVGLMSRVRSGIEVVIENGGLLVAVLHAPEPARRSIEACIALLPSESLGVIDEDFARDVPVSVPLFVGTL